MLSHIAPDLLRCHELPRCGYCRMLGPPIEPNPFDAQIPTSMIPPSEKETVSKLGSLSNPTQFGMAKEWEGRDALREGPDEFEVSLQEIDSLLLAFLSVAYPDFPSPSVDIAFLDLDKFAGPDFWKIGK